MKSPLADLQSLVQKSIVGGTFNASALLNKPPHGTAELAFKVYQDAYFLRLSGFLAHDYPLLKTYLGEDQFEQLAKAYILAMPSKHPNARWYSSQLPQFLATSEIFDDLPECIELAELEFALTMAFDAADAPVMTIAELAKIKPEDAGELQLRLQPSAMILAFRQNTTSIWSALKADMEPPRAHNLDNPQSVLVFRQDNAARFRLLGEEEATAIINVRYGMSFAVLCETMAFQNAGENVPQRAAMFLRGWVESQILQSASSAGLTK